MKFYFLNLVFRFLLTVGISLSISFLLTGCTLYQSSGREAIEKGRIDVTSGFTADFKSYYSCLYSEKMPDFLKQDLEILITKNEPEFVTVLATEKNNPAWVYVYTYNESDRFHYSCQVHKIEQSGNETEDLVNVGVLKINHLLKTVH